MFGYNHEILSISNLALDRIVSFREIKMPFVENNFVDFDEYFEDIIGVTLNENATLTKVILALSKNRWAYIDTKPIHGSQKVISRGQDYTMIELNMIINKELISLLFSYGADIIVLEPAELRQIILERANLLLKEYNTKIELGK